ncbi:hypothetical protein, partial [Xanthomonas campestris]|uniref:hypothetical protein n=1 Tax=Xanthomonas campestris TaxID=339 RepID=UPI001C847F33
IKALRALGDWGFFRGDYLPSELIRVAVGAGCSTAGFAMLLCAFWFALRTVWSVTLGRPLGTIGRA